MTMKFAALLLALLLAADQSHGWIASPSSLVSHNHHNRISTTRHYFFKNLLDKAFENDDSLSQNEKVTGQIEGPGDDLDNETVNRQKQLTATQERWRQINSKAADLADKSFAFDFFLTGVPNKDPSNDLFGARVNISSRDRKVGQTLPEEPTVSDIDIRFLANEKCVCDTDSSFTTGGSEGDWKLSDDGRQIRFRIQVSGFTRTVETRGSIQSVAWSNEPDKETRAATIYRIPEGWMYGEAQVSSGSRPGIVTWDDCVLKIEQPTGMLGAGTKMAPCGKFQARQSTTVANAVNEEAAAASERRGTL
eukprot:CAMPEP_0168742728 /NCGR_PEP_ID=MMETSP0724-20121128/13187_1 /TAXON_ID=265536 /ORGANISM="Amphiprora sp., Strain CCMP467" /LENGTH=305 /DNA_ID=CAMNT_0008790289 /DNA_START=5 /DNA_END=922 /DNA_ORIENTATION=+